jgi:hypothetical protein
MRKQIKKIVLTKETVRHLSLAEVTDVEGGILPQTNFNSCRCPTLSCEHVGFC